MRLLTTISFIMLIQLFQAQQWNSSRILHEIQKLNTLGNVLYLAAHPDDENTRFISYCANEKKMHTGYLSLTRGDGGQNLIGTEIREELGILRTQELLSQVNSVMPISISTRQDHGCHGTFMEESLGLLRHPIDLCLDVIQENRSNTQHGCDPNFLLLLIIIQ